MTEIIEKLKFLTGHNQVTDILENLDNNWFAKIMHQL